MEWKDIKIKMRLEYKYFFDNDKNMYVYLKDKFTNKSEFIIFRKNENTNIKSTSRRC